MNLILTRREQYAIGKDRLLNSRKSCTVEPLPQHQQATNDSGRGFYIVEFQAFAFIQRPWMSLALA